MEHIEHVIKKSNISNCEGKTIEVYELQLNLAPLSVQNWATHLRRHYCNDEDLEVLAPDCGMSKKEYLDTIVFPSLETPGPSIRSGDFAEILFLDFLEIKRGYVVARTRYDDKKNRDSSAFGSDIMGFKLRDKSAETYSSNDELIVMEVKSRASATKVLAASKLEDAVKDSLKDKKRIMESLNAVRKKARLQQDSEMDQYTRRFQNPVDNPYKSRYGAGTLQNKPSFSQEEWKKISIHEEGDFDCLVIVMYADKLMPFIHSLYTIAGDICE